WSLFSHLSIFLFTDPARTDIYTLSLHDALPIFAALKRKFRDGSPELPAPMPGNIFDEFFDRNLPAARTKVEARMAGMSAVQRTSDRKSTRLNSSHVKISYAVFCLKKKKREHRHT